MTDRRPKPKDRAQAGLPPLTPEAEAALHRQVDQVAAALEAGQDPAAVKELLAPSLADPSWDLHLIAALGALAHPAVPGLLAAAFGSYGDKARRKALKRSLHNLQSRGLAVPADLLPREEPAVGAARPPAVKALVSPVLGNGDRYLILEGPKEILGGNFLVVRLNDAAGLGECHLLNLKGRQPAELWEHYRQHGLAEWYPVSGPYAVRLLEEAFEQPGAAAAGRSAYGALREKVWKNWGRPEDAPDPEQALPVIDPGQRGRLLEQSRQLAADPLFQTWIPALEEITPWLEKLREVQESPLILSDQQKQVRTDGLLDEATRALYPPELRPLWRRRLLAMAYCLNLSPRREEALAARAAADDLSGSERPSLAGENPFLKSLVQVALRLAWELSQKPQEARSESGLVALPGDSPLLRR